MEEHAAVDDLHQTREELRELLMPGSRAGRALPGHFPRSTAMRLLMDTGKRRVAVAALTTALMFATGRRGAQARSRWPQFKEFLLPLLLRRQ